MRKTKFLLPYPFNVCNFIAYHTRLCVLQRVYDEEETKDEEEKHDEAVAQEKVCLQFTAFVAVEILIILVTQVATSE